MAQINIIKQLNSPLLTFCVLGALLAIPAHGRNDSASEVAFDPSEIPDPESLHAYHQFWDAFAEYEHQTTKTAVEEYQRTREGLESLYAAKERSLIEKRTATLDESIKRYTDNLEKSPNADNRPYVLLSLSQMYAELASLKMKNNPDAAKNNRKAALAILKKLDQDFKSFPYATDALYLRAGLLEAEGQPRDAGEIWKKLSRTGADKFTIYGNIVAGDNEFENASPDEAVRYYNKAKDILIAQEDADKGLDELRIFYRLAWAYFKAGHHREAIAAAKRVIAPGVLSKAARQKEKIAQDIAELTAYCLYEFDQDLKTREIITGRDYQSFGAATSLVLVQQYLTSELPIKALNVAELATTQFPLAKEYPDLLKLKAKAEDVLNKPSSKRETLEKLAMLLPRQSLWRLHHDQSLDLQKYAADLARSAANSVASSYYEDGLGSGNSAKFQMAATYFSILLEDQINTDQAPELRLKIANCYFFSGNYDEAHRRYSELITALKTPDHVLATAYFQRVLTLEKLWRQSFEASVQKNIDPVGNPETINSLKKLELAVDDHANKYPGQSRSVDLLLVAASANRDINRFEEASRFWQRSLLSSPSDGQRAIAIRGLVFAKLRSGKPQDVIAMITNFLKLEQDHTLANHLRAELLGVLASATSEEALRLSQKGFGQEGGHVLLDVVRDFSDIPNRDTMWRDGAYYLAIAGAWAEAQHSAEEYLATHRKAFAGDMTYLLARAHEYQLRFTEAVASYLALAENFPTHQRADSALDRAEKLAAADENYVMAAKASQLRAMREKSLSDRLHKYDTAVSYMLLAGQNAEAVAMANERNLKSKSKKDRLEAEINLAMTRYKAGDRQTAVDDLDSLDKQIERSKFELGDSYKRMASEVNFKIGEHFVDVFKELRIDSSKSNVSAEVDRKSKIFANIVTRFDKVASLDQPEYSPHARFLLAQAASDLADEITAIPVKNGENTTLRSQNRFNQSISRLRDLAAKYHGNNILAKQRSPNLYARNEWISKSALALSSASGRYNEQNETSDSNSDRSIDQLSIATSAEMPQEWNE